MFFRFIVGENIPSFGLERRLAYMLLIEEIVIIIVLDDLKIKKPQYQDKEQESEKAEQIEILAYSDESQKCLGLQPMLQFLIKTFMMGKRS